MASQEKSMPFIKNMASSSTFIVLPTHSFPTIRTSNYFLTNRKYLSNIPIPPPPLDRKLRDQALTSIRTFLSAKHISSSLSTLDILKLWKGLFYALWMCDRPLPQQQLCADLSALVWVLPQEAVAPWLRGFWATMAREWTTGIDVLRMEKFLLLVRRVLGVSLVWAQTRPEDEEGADGNGKAAGKSGGRRKSGGAAAGKKRSADGELVADSKKNNKKNESVPRWNAERTEQVLQLLADWPFRAEEESRREEDEEGLMPKMVPVGLKLHALDIWIDEAEKAGMLEGGDEEAQQDDDKKTKKTTPEGETLSGREVLQRINDLVEAMRAETRSTQVRIRSKDALADERLPWNEVEEDESDDGDEDVWRGLGD